MPRRPRRVREELWEVGSGIELKASGSVASFYTHKAISPALDYFYIQHLDHQHIYNLLSYVV